MNMHAKFIDILNMHELSVAIVNIPYGSIAVGSKQQQPIARIDEIRFNMEYDWRI